MRESWLLGSNSSLAREQIRHGRRKGGNGVEEGGRRGGREDRGGDQLGIRIGG